MCNVMLVRESAYTLGQLGEEESVEDMDSRQLH
jgi:hypothetical protein